MKATTLTMKDIKDKGLETYYKAVLFDEMYYEVDDTIGRFETLKEAKQECKRWANEEIDGNSFFEIWKYQLNEYGKYKRTEVITY